MSKLKSQASGVNSIKPKKATKKLGRSQTKSKDVVVEDLRKTIQRRYLRDSDYEKVEDRKNARKADIPTKQAKKKNSDTPVTERGKKRDHNGTILNHEHTKSVRPGGPAENENENENDDVLEKEMKELGGTAEDMDLLAEADSESEVEGDSSKTGVASLDKGMKNILKEIGLAQGEVGEDEAAPSDSGEYSQANGNIEQSTPAQGSKQDKSQRSKRFHFLCDQKPDWYNVPGLDFDTETTPKYTISKDSLDQLHEYARSLLDEENQKSQESQQSSSANAFYNTVIASGTLSDKISALTLAVQESPAHNMKALETLIGLARKRSRSQAVDVLRALKDLFAQGSLLPETRKLHAFQAQPALLHAFGNTRSWKTGDKLPRGLEQIHLVVYAFEGWLKEQYFEVLKVLEVWCNDEIEYAKARAVSYVYELLKERPEQEANLLRLLVNKLGDPVKKIASQASYFLMQLLITHPAMKMVVISAIESDFIFRPGQSLHGKYYAVVTLNQTALSGKEEDVAVKLLDIYFGLFTDLLKTYKTLVKDDTKEDLSQVNKSRRNRFRKPETTAPGQAQAEELREKLISAILTGVNRAYPYTATSDKSNTAFSEHLDTLFKITHSANFNTSVQSLMLIQQISHNSQHKSSSDRFYRVLYESLLDPRLIIASKQQLYLNLLHRALKADLHVNRVKAFVKRLVQVLSLHEPSFICGAFFLIQDLIKTFPSLKSLIDEAEDHDEDDIEIFRDVDDSDAEVPASTTLNDDSEAKGKAQGKRYDAHKRDPQHASANTTSLWDILPFLAHFHPSVSVSAEQLLTHRPLSGKPDLNLHTLSHFLDRFVYKNPKLAGSGLRGSSIMQPMATDNKEAVLLAGTTDGKRVIPVNSEQFRAKQSDEVAADDVFFHRYFTAVKKVSGKEKKKAERESRLKDVDGDGSDADEDEIWKAMRASAHDLEGDDFEDDDDEDLDLADLESDDGMADGDQDLAELEGEDEDEGEGVDIDPAFFDDDEDLMDINEPSVAAGAAGDEAVSEEDDFAGFDSDAEKSKKKARQDKKEKTKKLKNLPIFASAEDYAKVLEDDEGED